MLILPAQLTDLEEILKLQKQCYLSEAEIYDDYSIPPLHQSIEDIEKEYSQGIILKASIDNRLVGSVRAYAQENTCYIGKLIVGPQYQNRGIGKKLMEAIEASFHNCNKFELFTGHKSLKNIAMYEKIGYQIFNSKAVSPKLTLVYMQKVNA